MSLYSQKERGRGGGDKALQLFSCLRVSPDSNECKLNGLFDF